jgi:hypothetical protein
MNLKVILQEIGELTECGLPRYFLGTVNGAGDQIPNAKQLEDAVFECVADHIVSQYLSTQVRSSFGTEVAKWSPRRWAEALLCRYEISVGEVLSIKVEFGELVTAVHLAFL